MGHTSGIKFNWWNVMEYSIGFFGGLGMAYGIFSNSRWPKTVGPHKVSNILAWTFLIVLLPVINLIESAGSERMISTGKGIQAPDPAAFAFNWQATLWVMSVLFMLALTYYYKPALQGAASRKKAAGLTLFCLTWYIIISNVVSATWLTPKFSSQHLYWVNLVIIGLFLRNESPDTPIQAEGAAPGSWPVTVLKWWVAAVLCILLLAYIATLPAYVHPNSQIRFQQ